MADRAAPPKKATETLWDIVVKQKKTEADQNAVNNVSSSSDSATVVILGHEKAGKTTIAQKYNKNKSKSSEQSTTPQMDQDFSSSFLEFSYAEGENKNGEKAFVNFWELAGGLSYLTLLEDLITPDTFESFVLVLLINLDNFYSNCDKFLDLSGKKTREEFQKEFVASKNVNAHKEMCLKALEVFIFFDALLSKVFQCTTKVKQFLEKKGSSSLSKTLETSKRKWKAVAKRIDPNSNPDSEIESINFCGIPILIVASKADLFQKQIQNKEIRDTILSILRSMSHKNSCSLVSLENTQKKDFSMTGGDVEQQQFQVFKIWMNHLIYQKPLSESTQSLFKVSNDTNTREGSGIRAFAGSDSFAKICENSKISNINNYNYSALELNLMKKLVKLIFFDGINATFQSSSVVAHVEEKVETFLDDLMKLYDSKKNEIVNNFVLSTEFAVSDKAKKMLESLKDFEEPLVDRARIEKKTELEIYLKKTQEEKEKKKSLILEKKKAQQ